MAKTIEEVFANKVSEYLNRLDCYLPAVAVKLTKLNADTQRRLAQLIIEIVHIWAQEWDNGSPLVPADIAKIGWDMDWGYRNREYSE